MPRPIPRFLRTLAPWAAAALIPTLVPLPGCADGHDPPPPVMVWCEGAATAGESPFHLLVNVHAGTVVAVDSVPRPEGCLPEADGGGAVRWEADRHRAVVTLSVVNRTNVPATGLALEVRFVGDDDGVPIHAPRVDTSASYMTPDGWRAVPVTPSTLSPGETGTAEIVVRVTAAAYDVGIGGSTIDATGGYRVEIAGGLVARPTAPPPAPQPYLVVEAEDLHPGPAGSGGLIDGWVWPPNYNGASGAGAVSTSGLASAPLCATVSAPRAGDWRVWARSGELAGTVDVTLGGVTIGTAVPGPLPGWSWTDLGAATLAAGPTDLCLVDASAGGSVTDVIVLSTDAAADPVLLLRTDHQLLDPQLAHAAGVETVAARLVYGESLVPPLTLAEWNDLRDTFEAALLDGLGFDHDHPDPALAPEIIDVLDRGDHVIEKIRFYPHPDLPATGLLYLPGAAAGGGPFPLVLSPVGHWGPGKAYDPEQLRNISLARLGYVAFSMDPPNQGERVAAGNDHFMGLSHYLVGDGLGAEMVLEWMRALDWLVARPEVDPALIAVSGASGGGTLSMFLGALDDRIVAVAPVVSVGSWANLMVDASRGDPEQYPFGAGAQLPQWGILALSAPKPMLVIAADGDTTFPADGAEEVAGEAAPVWDLYAGGTSLDFRRFPGPHNYDVARREAFYAWLEGVFRGDPSPVVEAPAMPESESALDVGLGPSPTTTVGLVAAHVSSAGLPGVPAPATAAEAEALADDARATLEIYWGTPPAPGATPPLVTALGTTTGDGLGTICELLLVESELPRPEDADGYAFEAELYRSAGWPGGPGATGPAVVYLSDGGKESAVHVPALLARGFAVLAIDARLTGAMLPGLYDFRISRMSALAALGVGESVAGWRLADVFAAVRALAARADVDPARIAVVGGGNETGAVALAAAALDPLVAAAAADLALGSLADALRAEAMVPPGLVTERLVETLDVAVIVAAAAPKPVLLVRTHDPVGAPLEPGELAAVFSVASAAYEVLGAPASLSLVAPVPSSPGATLADFLAAALAP